MLLHVTEITEDGSRGILINESSIVSIVSTGLDSGWPRSIATMTNGSTIKIQENIVEILNNCF